ncbi:MAG: hypothetical protein ACM3SY_19155 [Candidatus Omnitrophota bacterium]
MVRKIISKEIVTIILVSIVIFNYCSKKGKDSKDIPTQYVKINEQKVSNVHFTLKKRFEVSALACPRIAVSPYQDKIIIYGLSTKKEEEARIVAQMYNKNLEFINEKSFLFGQGPGDASAFNLFSFSKDKILVSGNSNHRVTIYTNDWSLEEIKQHRLITDSFEIFENGTLFLIGEFDWGDKWDYYSLQLGSIPSFKTKTFFRFGPFRLFENKKTIWGELTEYSWFYRNKEIYMLDCGRYRILKFDITGRKLKDVQFIVEKIKTDHSMDNEYFLQNNISQHRRRFRFSDTVDPAASIIPLSKGFIVVRRYSYLTDCSNMIVGDYFSNDLKHIGKVKVPCFEAALQVHGGRRNESFKYDNGFLYLTLSQEDSDWIEKWEVHE